MLKKLLFITSLVIAGCSSSPEKYTSKAENQPLKVPQIILKLDDLKYDKHNVVDPGWSAVINYLNQENIVGTIGIVGSSLSKNTPEYFDWIKQRDQEGYEIWHHGYCHCRWDENGQQIREYQGSGYEKQQKSLMTTQSLAQEKLGLTFRTFGAPYNATDGDTASILEQIEGIKIWLFKDTNAPTSKFVLPRVGAVNIEYPVHKPDFNKFKSGYLKHRTKDVLVIQGHPRSWVKEPQRFEEFKRIIKYLKAQNVTFTTPFQYYLSKQAS